MLYKLVKGARIAGKVKSVVGAGQTALLISVAPASRRSLMVVEELGAFVGGSIGGALGAALGAKIGAAASPAGSVIGSFVGGIAGGFGGDKLGRKAARRIYARCCDQSESEEASGLAFYPSQAHLTPVTRPASAPRAGPRQTVLPRSKWRRFRRAPDTGG